jgi:hypothetical protein
MAEFTAKTKLQFKNLETYKRKTLRKSYNESYFSENKSNDKIVDKALNEKSFSDLITENILRNFDISFKLLLKYQYLSGVSLIECVKIPIKQNFDYECEITIQMNDKHEKEM